MPRGRRRSRNRRPSLSRREVEEFTEARARAAREREQVARQSGPRPPDDEHDWLNAPEAGVLMGVGPEAVRVRARRGKLPSELHDGRRWFRRDHLELVKRADVAKRLGRPVREGA